MTVVLVGGGYLSRHTIATKEAKVSGPKRTRRKDLVNLFHLSTSGLNSITLVAFTVHIDKKTARTMLNKIEITRIASHDDCDAASSMVNNDNQTLVLQTILFLMITVPADVVIHS